MNMSCRSSRAARSDSAAGRRPAPPSSPPSQAKDKRPEEVLIQVRKDVDKFVGGAEQFDDLTMLCLKYTGTKE